MVGCYLIPNQKKGRASSQNRAVGLHVFITCFGASEVHPLCKVPAHCSHFPIDLSAASLQRSSRMRAFSSALSNHFIPFQKGRKLSGDTLINSVFSAVKNRDIYNLFWKKNKSNIILLKIPPHPSPKPCLTLFHSDNTANVSGLHFVHTCVRCLPL